MLKGQSLVERMDETRNGLCANLMRFASDEGKDAAVRTAERWHAALEEMGEVANEEQRQAVRRLLGAVDTFIEIAAPVVE
jgi:hypothetical protein